MTRMNFSRPNGGYEKEVWNKELDKVNSKLKSGKNNAQLSGPVTILKSRHDDHSARVKLHVGVPVLWCNQCQTIIMIIDWASYNDLK